MATHYITGWKGDFIAEVLRADDDPMSVLKVEQRGRSMILRTYDEGNLVRERYVGFSDFAHDTHTDTVYQLRNSMTFDEAYGCIAGSHETIPREFRNMVVSTYIDAGMYNANTIRILAPLLTVMPAVPDPSIPIVRSIADRDEQSCDYWRHYVARSAR